MPKKYHLELVVQDEGLFVKSVMADDKRIVLDYKNTDTRQVRVRAPVLSRSKFIESAQYWVSKGLQPTIEAHITVRIQCLEQEVFKQVNEVRKSMKRISSSMKSIKIAREEFEKYKARADNK